jgi:hypothetical protein
MDSLDRDGGITLGEVQRTARNVLRMLLEREDAGRRD